jgi:hypothetical protein
LAAKISALPTKKYGVILADPPWSFAVWSEENVLADDDMRIMLHTYATDADDPTVQPRWGKVGKQRIEDAGELCPKRMETVDDEILSIEGFIEGTTHDARFCGFRITYLPSFMYLLTR